MRSSVAVARLLQCVVQKGSSAYPGSNECLFEQSGHSPLTCGINEAFLTKRSAAHWMVLLFAPFFVNPRDGCAFLSFDRTTEARFSFVWLAFMFSLPFLMVFSISSRDQFLVAFYGCN